MGVALDFIQVFPMVLGDRGQPYRKSSRICLKATFPINKNEKL